MALGSSWIDSSALRLHLGDGDISPWDTEIILGVPYGDEYNLSVDFYWSRRVDDLFDQWKADPCWDVETTEGFEWAHDRLLSLRLEYQAKVDAVYESMLKEKATQLGIPENLPLAEYILRLEHRISRLQDRLESL